tara:strand:- start:366 stop:1673 length:1308 start_codon:yes stop_codon:yes gene_type:complete
MTLNTNRILVLVVVGLTTLLAEMHSAFGFTYVTAAKDADAIVHPTGYTGRGGELTITLGLHPDFEEMEDEVAFTAEHIAAIWTSLLIWDENLEPSLEIPKLGGTDFFGTLIHEFGHTLGLAHPTLMPQGLNLPRGEGKFTTAEPGPNGKLDLDEGKDGLRGSADDERGDDVNAVFFKKADNDPYTLPESGVVDSTTYSRKLGDLPEGDQSPTVSSREVARKVYSLEATEGMMVSGGSLIPGQVRRGLSADDIAGIRYAMSGLDEIQGTGDDYTLKVEYVGVDDDADVMIRFDMPQGFAAAFIGSRPLNDTHKAMGKNRIINYNPKMTGNRKWFFPQPESADCDASVINSRAVSLKIQTEPGARYGISWPEEALKEGEGASDIIVQWDGENRSPMSGRLFLFVAKGANTEINIAFPSEAPDLDGVNAFRVIAREAN